VMLDLWLWDAHDRRIKSLLGSRVATKNPKPWGSLARGKAPIMCGDQDSASLGHTA
jgi:hypothetical protein